MPKLNNLIRLSIISLVFLISGCTTTAGIVNSGAVRVGMSKGQLRDAFLPAAAWEDPFYSGGAQYDSPSQTEIIWADSRTYFFVFSNVTRPKGGVAGSRSSDGNGTLRSWHSSLNLAQSSVARIRTGNSSASSSPGSARTPTTPRINSTNRIDPNRSPRYGRMSLSSIETTRPVLASVNVLATIGADTIKQDCVGFVNYAPAINLEFRADGQTQLGVLADSDVDSTLLIRDPSGSWSCSDDLGGDYGQRPGLMFENAARGTYNIYVGVYNREDERARATISVFTSPEEGSRSFIQPQPQVSSGTGFVVSEQGHILTNHHVIDACDTIEFQVRGAPPTSVQLISSNESADLALLMADQGQFEVARFRDSGQIRLGEEIVAFGFPFLGDLSSQGNITSGIVSALSGMNDDLSRIQITAQIQPGNSGGPIFDRYGLVSGVVVSRASDSFFLEDRGSLPQNINFAIRESTTISFLDTNNINYRTQSVPSSQLSISDIAELAQGFTGVLTCNR